MKIKNWNFTEKNLRTKKRKFNIEALSKKAENSKLAMRNSQTSKFLIFNLCFSIFIFHF